MTEREGVSVCLCPLCCPHYATTLLPQTQMTAAYKAHSCSTESGTESGIIVPTPLTAYLTTSPRLAQHRAAPLHKALHAPQQEQQQQQQQQQQQHESALRCAVLCDGAQQKDRDRGRN
eukprot:COSAG02_NODE_1025_length_15146_cov_21.959460_5_plen_118_part_00